MRGRWIMTWSVLFFALRTYPSRVQRFVFHFVQWAPFFKNRHLSSSNLLVWCMDLFCYLIDLLLISVVMEWIIIWTCPKISFLSERQRKMAVEYFSDSIDLDVIKVNNRLTSSLQRKVHAFVTFNTIHFHDQVSNAVFVHELVHIWQYQKLGSVYIARALMAQQSKAGYNYGGLETLYHGMLGGRKFLSFNFEQQGEIFEDYYRVINTVESLRTPLHLASYEYFVDQIKSNDLSQVLA